MCNDICKIFAPSGREDALREYIVSAINSRFDKVEVDSFGNVIAATGTPELYIECGLDGCGIMLTSLEDGKAHFAGVGGINAEYLIGKKIIFDDLSVGIVRFDGKDKSKSQISDLYLECSTKSRKIGDFGVVKSGYCETDEAMFANGLSNKAGVMAVVAAISGCDKIKDVGVLFSAQKRLGARGIRTFFGNGQFEKVLTVEGVSAEKVKEASIVVADKNGVCGKELKEQLLKIFDKVAVCDENLCMGDIIIASKGAQCGALAIPVSNKDDNFEKILKKDFNCAADVLKKVLADGEA